MTRRNRKSFAGVALAVLIALATTGCPDTQVFNTGTFEVALVTTATEVGDALCVMMSVETLNVVPLDGKCEDTGDPCFDKQDCNLGLSKCLSAGASDVIPGQILTIVTETLEFTNFTDQGQPCEELTLDETGQDFPLLILSPGLYEIRNLQIGLWAYVDSVVTDVGDRNDCATYTPNVDDIPEYDEQRLFTVGEDQPNRIEFVVNAERLKENLEGPDPSCLVNLRPPGANPGNGGIFDVFSIQ